MCVCVYVCVCVRVCVYVSVCVCVFIIRILKPGENQSSVRPTVKKVCACGVVRLAAPGKQPDVPTSSSSSVVQLWTVTPGKPPDVRVKPDVQLCASAPANPPVDGDDVDFPPRRSKRTRRAPGMCGCGVVVVWLSQPHPQMISSRLFVSVWLCTNDLVEVVCVCAVVHK